MMLLDMWTIVFSYLITDIICVWFMVLLWRQSRGRFAGTAFLVVDFGFQAAALVLVVMRGAIPDWMSMVLSNTLVIAGAILGFQGLERFVGKRGPQIHNYLLVALFIFVHGYFSSVQPNLAVRNLNLAVALLLVCFQSVWLLWRRVEPGLRSLTFGVGLVNLLYCLISVIRILEFFTRRNLATDYFQSGTLEALVLISYQMLFILLTYSLVLMVNKRLLMEIGTQEEKFSKAFHSSPYAITLSRLSDGTLVDVNESFVAISGYDRAEALGKKSLDLNIWEHEEDRAAVVDALSRSGKVRGMELRFRKRSGEAVTGLFSAEIITIDNQECILSSISDITERKRVEQEQLRLTEEIRMLLQSTGEGIYGTDTNGRFTFINRAGAAMLGYSPEELIGKPAHALVHHSHRDGSAYPSEECPMNRTLLLGRECREDNEVLWRKDGASFPVRYSSHPIVQGGEIQGVVVNFQDITERKLAEKALGEERRRLQKALEDVRTLRGIIPICATCKKIRDDKGFWNQVENYVSEHSEAEFSHGICPECMNKLYPECRENEA